MTYTPSSSVWFGLVWVLLTCAVFMVPLIPALRELYSRSDSDALDIDHFDNGRTDYDAQRMLDRLPLLEGMSRIEQWQKDDRGLFIIPRGQSRLSAKTLIPLVLGFRSQVQSLVSAETVELQANSVVTKVLHAKNVHCLGPVILAPKTSAVQSIVLAPGTRFQRLSAQCTFTWPLKRNNIFPIDQIGNGMPLTELQRRHDGDLHITAGMHVMGGLVVTGDLYMHEAAVVTGHIKVHGTANLAQGACVKGALFSLEDVRTAGNNYIEGPLSAANNLRLGPNSQVGNKQVPSSTTAWSIQLEASVRLYGSLSAVRRGDVLI